MPIRILIFATVLAVLSGDGSKEGRQGNAHYKAEQYREAAGRYVAGLQEYGEEDETGRTYYGLQNNLGAALHRAEEFESAHLAFQLAMMTAPGAEDYARAAYNDGNNAVRSQDLEAALQAYRNALLADPTDEDARFNYEFIKRQQQQQEQQGEGDNENQQSDENQDQSDEGSEQGDNEDEQSQDDAQNDDQNQQQDGDEQQQQQPNEPEENEEQEQQNQDASPQQQEPQDQLSRQQAERILQALQNEEEQLLREVQQIKGQPQRVEKDW